MLDLSGILLTFIVWAAVTTHKHDKKKAADEKMREEAEERRLNWLKRTRNYYSPIKVDSNSAHDYLTKQATHRQ